MSSDLSVSRSKSLVRWWIGRRDLKRFRGSRDFRSQMEWLETRLTPSGYTAPATTDQLDANRLVTREVGLLLVVSGLNPTSGPAAGDSSVTIAGTGFTGATAVDFGSTPALNFTVNADSQITATAPAGKPGTVDVTVTTPGGVSAISNADEYAYVTAPAVTAVSPTSGPELGGTSVTITGTDFTGTTAVDFGSTLSPSFTVNSDSQIVAIAPAGSPGPVDVTVTTAGGISAISNADQFTFAAAPVVTSISPAIGPDTGGTSVTINGSQFNGATAVDFGTTPAKSFAINSASQIIAVAPAGTVGTVDVSVVTPGGASASSAADQYTYVFPTITVNTNTLSVGSTTSGIAGVTQSLTFSGSNLAGNVMVSAPTGVELSDDGGNSWSTSLILPESNGALSNTSVDVRISASAAPGGISGYVSAASNGATSQYVLLSGTVNPAPTSVTGISPNVGPVSGGTAVTITGTNLADASVVLFGGARATQILSDTPTQIVAVTPASPAGAVPVTVITSIGVSSPGALFTYSGGPLITVTPDFLDLGTTTSGTVGTANYFTIAGFELSAQVTIDAPRGVKISADGHSWHRTLTLVPTNGTLSDMRIYATIRGVARPGVIESSILVASPGTLGRVIAVHGVVHRRP